MAKQDNSNSGRGMLDQHRCVAGPSGGAEQALGGSEAQASGMRSPATSTGSSPCSSTPRPSDSAHRPTSTVGDLSIPLMETQIRHNDEESDSVKIIYSLPGENGASNDIVFISNESEDEPDPTYYASESCHDTPEGCYDTSESGNSDASADQFAITASGNAEQRGRPLPAAADSSGGVYDLQASGGSYDTSAEMHTGPEYGDSDDSLFIAGTGGPGGGQSSDSDIQVISSVIREVPRLAPLPLSFLRNDINDYSRVLGIELMPPGCRLRRIHATTVRLWSCMVRSESFPSLEDFRTLSRRLRAEERAAKRRSPFSLAAEQESVPPDAGGATDDMFPEHPPAVSHYTGPIRYDLIEYECIGVVMERIQWVMSYGTHREAVGLMRFLTDLASVFSRSEVDYITDVVFEEFMMEGFADANAASMIAFAHDWACQSNTWRLYSRKKYNVVNYGQLLDVHDTACHVCYEGFKKKSRVAVMDCLHVFHSKCLNLWLRESPRCPLCRALPALPNLTK